MKFPLRSKYTKHSIIRHKYTKYIFSCGWLKYFLYVKCKKKSWTQPKKKNINIFCLQGIWLTGFMFCQSLKQIGKCVKHIYVHTRKKRFFCKKGYKACKKKNCATQYCSTHVEKYLYKKAHIYKNKRMPEGFFYACNKPLKKKKAHEM